MNKLLPLKIAGIIVCLILFVAFLAFPKIGPGPELDNQLVMSVVLLALGYYYYKFREFVPKIALGVLAISAALASNWFEIGKMTKDNVNRGERIILVFAAIAVTAHGFKQLKEARSGKEIDE